MFDSYSPVVCLARSGSRHSREERDFMKGLAYFLLIASIAAFGQTPSATITGIVKDPSGAVVADAKVTIRNEGTNLTHEVSTSKNGDYTVPLLDIGQYTISVEAQG